MTFKFKQMMCRKRYKFPLCLVIFLLTFFLIIYIFSLYSPMMLKSVVGKINVDTSPFYGMNHRHTYGQPLSYFTNKTINKTNYNWKIYFAKTMKAIEEFEAKNPTDNNELYTHTFKISTNKAMLNFGEELVATIISLDGKNERKTFGGDYYRARLIRNNQKYPDGIPCKVTDNADGSYTVKAPLLLEGNFNLEVKLVLPAEGVFQTIKETEALSSWGFHFNATLSTNEHVICDVNLTTFEKYKDQFLCDYTNPRNMEPWVCERPKSNKCSPIVNVTYCGSAKKTIYDFQRLCSKYGCNICIQTVSISVKNINGIRNVEYNLPFCNIKIFENSTETKITGFFQTGVWRTTQCKLLPTEKLNLFKNKIFYFFGDSTIRQFFYLFASQLQLIVTGPDNSKIWKQPKVAFTNSYGKTYNTTMYYRAHGPPLLNPGPPNTRPYISDLIEDIPVGGKDVYIIFNIGAHLYLYNPNIYLHRLKGIKKAIIKHHKKFPETRFIVRGLNVVEFPYEYNIYRFETLLYETFRYMRHVMYLNLWDMTTVWPLNDYHPDRITLQQQSLVMSMKISV